MTRPRPTAAPPAFRTSRRRHRRAGMALLLPALGLLAAGCGDAGTGPGPGQGREEGVVLNSVDISLSLVDAAADSVEATVGLGPAGSPVGVAVRGGMAAVPMGVVAAVAVVDLATRQVVTYGLPSGSGATGAAFVDDTLLLVANPGLGSVSPVNLRTGMVGAPIAVGNGPQGVVVVGDRVVVINAELGPDYLPEGPGTLTLLDARTLERVGTVTLSGENPGDAAPGPDGLLYVVNSGGYGEGNGSLSVVDVAAGREVEHDTGFGDFPFAVEVGPEGRVYVASFSYGVAVWDPASRSFVRAPDAAVAPAGIPSTSGMAFDAEGRLHTLVPECQDRGRVLRLDTSFQVAAEVTVGTCPTGIAFTRVPAAAP